MLPIIKIAHVKNIKTLTKKTWIFLIICSGHMAKFGIL